MAQAGLFALPFPVIVNETGSNQAGLLTVILDETATWINTPLIVRREAISEFGAVLFAGIEPSIVGSAAAVIQALIARQELPIERLAMLLWPGAGPIEPPPSKIVDYILRARRRRRR